MQYSGPIYMMTILVDILCDIRNNLREILHSLIELIIINNRICCLVDVFWVLNQRNLCIVKPRP